MTFLEQLSTFHDRRPLRPFVIRTDDGDAFIIGDPQRLMIDVRGQRIAFFDPKGRFILVEAAHVVTFEEPAPAAR